MKKFVRMIVLLFSLVVIAGCSTKENYDIITTMFPQYDFARQIVGDKLSVGLLLPLGTEGHDYEATSRDLIMIKESKLFIFTSLDIDTWIKNPEAIGGANTIVMNLSEHYVLSGHEHHEDDHLYETSLNGVLLSETDDDHDDDDHDHDNQIHFWVDPTTAIQLIEAILEKIIEIDPENASYYEENAHTYMHELEELHEAMDIFFQNELYHDQTFYFAGHNALGAFADRYHFEIVSLFPDFKPDADLTSSELSSFIHLIKTNQVTYLFIEELVEPKAAITIQNALANENYTITLRELHGFHNITEDEWEDGITYLDLLQRNFDYLKEALGA